MLSRSSTVLSNDETQRRLFVLRSILNRRFVRGLRTRFKVTKSTRRTRLCGR